MSYEIEIRYVPLTHAVCLETNTPTDKIGDALAEIFPRVSQFLVAKHQRPAGPPFARYVAWCDETCDIQAGFPIAGEMAVSGDFKYIEMGECEAAYTIHRGSYDELATAHQAIKEWIEHCGQEVSGPPWEVYVTDPGEHPDPNEWVSAVYWPLE